MNLKIVFGVALPALVIVLLTIFSSINVGFSADKTYISSLSLDDVFTKDAALKSQIKIGEVRLSNEYFLPKRYELPAASACLVDDDGVKQPMDAGYVSYSEGDPSYNSDMYGSYSYYQRGRGSNVEVGSGETKKVGIFLNPENLYAYSYGSNLTQKELIMQEYGDYDAVVLLESKGMQDSYNSCYGITASQIDSARKITLK